MPATHRAPSEAAASWNSPVERGRPVTVDPLPRAETGAEQLVIMNGLPNRVFESHLDFAAHGELLPVDPPIRGAA